MIDLTKEKALTLRKAAALVGVCHHTIRAMIRRGELEGVMFGGKVYTSEEAIRRAQSTPVPASAAPPRSTAAVQSAAQRAEALLSAAGW